MQGQRNQEVGAALLRGLRAGSSQAWAELYDRLAPGIHRFAVSGLSGDAETAQEVVVETLADAARRIGRFDPEKSSLSAWVYGIARRVVQVELRKRSRRKSVPAWAEVSFEDLAELSDSEDLGARAAARVDAERRVREAAGLVSEPELEMLALSSVGDLSVREIGRVVGRSEQATHMLLHRARQKARRVGIEGTLLCGELRTLFEAPRISGSGHWFTGLEDWRSGGEAMISPELSPAGDEVVYYLHGPEVSACPPVLMHVWKARPDGSEAVNLSEAAGLRGINCYPKWSPDGTMIAFSHRDEPGWGAVGPGEAWVMKADGSEARRVAPEAVLPASAVAWSREGSCLLCAAMPGSRGALPASVDLWGRQVGIVVVGTREAAQSPDGSRIASTRRVPGEVEGERGWWNQLVVTKADGSGPKVLVEQFVADEGVATHGCLGFLRELDHHIDWAEDLRRWAGPHDPTWSPQGDKIAFLAAMPFDPEGLPYRLQVDAWVYDLVTNRLTKVTQGTVAECSLSWR